MPDEYRFLVDGHIPVLKLHSEPRPGPAVLVLHGLGADAETQRGELRVLAEGGLSAVGVDAPHHGARRNGWLEARARLGPSEAHAWLLRAVQDWARDVSRVIDHLMHEGHGPIGLAGISFGAYTALAVATEDARVRATVSLLGSPDWSPREGPITGELQELTRHAPVHRPWECARNPLLLVNAGRDGIVPPHRARDFARRLQAEQSPGSAPVEYLEYPESDHMMRPEDWEDGWRRTLGFLQRHLGVLALLLVSLCLSSPAQAQTWSLTHEQRQAFLHHYAPIVLKRANANNDRHGYDWITNFDFDQDGDFSNNKRNWKNIPQYINASRTGTGAYAHWRIRPTLYTSLIEFMDGGKNLVLIYHVYHALDKNAAGDYQLHDWERVELLVKNVVGPPGSGESVAHAVVTQHKRNVIRRLGDAQLNFLSTATGHHLLIWQAEWSDKLLAAHGQELRFVTQPGAWVSAQLAANAKAEVGVNNDSGKKNVHYAFVPRGSPGAVSTFGAEALTLATAERLASRSDNGKTVAWSDVKRVTYELQDIADILPTHWEHGGYTTHWLGTHFSDFWLESPITNTAGQALVSAGMQRFFSATRDIDNEDDRDGYPTKKWLFGTYELNASASDTGGGGSGAFHDNAWASTVADSRGRTRASASGHGTSPNAFWWQHDYFVHSGDVDSTDGVETGFWLPGAWYLAANGGFDGRWVQLFPPPVD